MARRSQARAAVLYPPRQPGAGVGPIGRADLAAPHLPGLGVEVVEGDLFPVDIQPAYDGHRDLLTLRRAHARAPARIAYAVHRDASELGEVSRHPAATSAQFGPVHVI